jgi:hypothetical protein
VEKVQRQELLKQEALIAARLLQGAEIELRPMRFLIAVATRMSIEIDHPAYDCLYLALAVETECAFVTADERFLRKLHQGRQPKLRGRAISLIEAAKLWANIWLWLSSEFWPGQVIVTSNPDQREQGIRA